MQTDCHCRGLLSFQAVGEEVSYTFCVQDLVA